MIFNHSLYLKVAKHDTLRWSKAYHYSLVNLHLNNGGNALIGRGGFVRRTVFGVMIRSSVYPTNVRYNEELISTRRSEKIPYTMEPSSVSCEANSLIEASVGKGYESFLYKELSTKLIRSLEKQFISMMFTPNTSFWKHMFIQTETTNAFGVTTLSVRSRPIVGTVLRFID